MNKALKVALPVAGGLALVAAAAVFLTAPGRLSRSRRDTFVRRNYAHRGLHDDSKNIPENSEAAFRAAAERGYGVEIDVRMTSDDEPVVFHDDDLDRMCESPARVDETDSEQLAALRLGGTQEAIPSLDGALEAVDGRTPIIIELKHGKNDRLLCEKVLESIDGHTGSFCVQSFDPRILAWFRKNAPDIVRGQLICSLEELKREVPRPLAFVICHALTNVIARPHFISHKLGCKAIGVQMCEALGAMRFVWTSRSLGNEETNDAIIFEGYLPRPTF